MPLVRNPILPGFNPDPSILRVGSDYYIATSTFEWYPGVQIHHSTDLANWTLICRPLTRAAQLDMRGDPDSCGIWAPCLTHDGEKFWLVYTDVKRKDGSFKDTHNYIVTAPDIMGPWSDPIYVNSSGFDPSLFHDPDTGKKYFINMLWDHTRRTPGKYFSGIALQEFSPSEGKLVGKRTNIYRGTDLALVEGPHLYKRGEYYYLLVAEGGTAYEHACTLARSKTLEGPYETHPDKHVITSKDAPGAPLQRTGHGDIVDTPDGTRTYLVHLCGRPVKGLDENRCVLGRETAIQECEWRDDGWLYLKNGTNVGSLDVDLPGARDEVAYYAEKKYTFSPDAPLPIDFQWLRTPETERVWSLSANPGKLTLYGRESIGSWFEQSLVARRQQHFSYDTWTVLAKGYAPQDERQFAGLTAYYSRYNFFFLAVSADENGRRELWIMSSEKSWPDGDLEYPFPTPEPVPIPGDGRVLLKASVREGKTLQFYYSLLADGDDASTAINNATPIGPVLDASKLSDECGGHQAHGSFTGAFVGMAASDLNGTAMPAVFEGFTYTPLK